MVFIRSRKSMYTGFSVLLPAGTKCPPEWYNDWHFVFPNRDNRSSLILVPITLSSLPITCNVGIIDSSNLVAFVELWINSIAYIWSNWTKNSKRIFKAKKYVNMKIITVSGIYPPYKYVHAETNENRIPRKRYQI